MHPFFSYNYFLFFYKNQELFCDAQLFLIFRKGAIKLSNQIKSNICPEQALSVRLCVYVCVCVSVTAFHFNTIRPILIKLRPIDLIKYLRWRFSQILKILLWWRHGGYFVYFLMRHSHFRNYASIFFKFIDRKFWYLPMFAIEN